MCELIGLSLGFCIKDILENEILEKEVRFIIANTKCTTEEEWEALEKECLRAHWNDDIEGVMIMRRLKEAGKIIQPKLFNPEFHASLDKGRWFLNTYEQEIENGQVPSRRFGYSWIYGGGVQR